MNWRNSLLWSTHNFVKWRLQKFEEVPLQKLLLPDQHAVTGPIKESADAWQKNALCWPAKKPFADRPFLAVCWPAMFVFLLYADRPCKSLLLYVLWFIYFWHCFCYMLTGHVNTYNCMFYDLFVFGTVFAICWLAM